MWVRVQVSPQSRKRPATKTSFSTASSYRASGSADLFCDVLCCKAQRRVLCSELLAHRSPASVGSTALHTRHTELSPQSEPTLEDLDTRQRLRTLGVATPLARSAPIACESGPVVLPRAIPRGGAALFCAAFGRSGQVVAAARRCGSPSLWRAQCQGRVAATARRRKSWVDPFLPGGKGRSEIADGTEEGEGCGAAYGKCLAERLGAPEEHIAHTKCCEALLRVVCQKMCPQRIRSNARAERRVQPHDVFNFRHGRIWRLCLLTATSSCLLDRSPQLHARESCSATTWLRIAGWEVASTCFVAARSCSPDMDLGPPARTGLAAEGKPAAPCCGQEGRRNFHKLSIRDRKLPATIAELDGRGRH